MEKNENDSLIQKPVVDIETSGVKGEDNKVVSEGFQNVNNNFYGKERKVWPFVLIGVLVLLVGLGCFYYFVYMNPKNIVEKSINSAFTKIQSNNKKYTNVEVDTIKLNTDILVNTEDASLKDINGLNAKVNLGLDFKNENKNYLDLDVSLNKEKLFNGIMSFVDNKVYLDLKDAFSKVMYFENEEDFLEEYNMLVSNKIDINEMSKNLEYLFENIKSSLLKNISSDKLSKEILLKEIDGKKVPAVDVTYSINYNEFNKLINGICDGLLNDSKALEILSSLSEVSVDEIKEGLKEAKEGVSSDEFPGTIKIVFTVNAFTKEFIQMNATISVLNIKITDTKSEFKIEATMLGMVNAKVVVDKKEDKINMDVSAMNSFRFVVNTKVESLTETSGQTTATFIIYDPEDINKEMTTITGKFNYEYNKEIQSVNIENAVNADDLTEEEQEQVLKILEPVTSLFQSNDVDYVLEIE